MGFCPIINFAGVPALLLQSFLFSQIIKPPALDSVVTFVIQIVYTPS